MSFEYGLSIKNKTTLIYNGFEYTKKQSTKTTFLWICRYIKQFNCKATIITCGDTIIKFPKEHCCQYVPGEAEARKIKAAIFSVDVFTEFQLTGNRLRPPPGAKVAHYPSLLLFYITILEPCP